MASNCPIDWLILPLIRAQSFECYRASIRYKRVKRRVIILVSATAFLLLVEIFVRRSAPTLAPYGIDTVADRFARLVAYEPEPRILLLGSSRTKFGLAPEVFERMTGYPTYNLGIAASFVYEWRSVARRAMQEVDPDVIVIGINGRSLRSNSLPIRGASQFFDFQDIWEYSLHHQWSNELIDYYCRYQVMANFAFWDRSDQIRMWLNESVLCGVFPKHAQMARERRELHDRIMPADGFDHPWRVTNSTRTLPALVASMGEDRLPPPAVPFFDENDEAVQILSVWLAELRSADKQVLLCYIPNSPRTEAAWQQHEPKFIETIAAIARRHDVPFLDASMGTLPRTDADFFDDTHVGVPLALRLSARVAEHLIRLGMIDTPELHLAGNLEMEAPGE